MGEIDIIAKDSSENTLVFVEVKTRNWNEWDTLPEENITPGKLRKLAKIANAYLRQNNLEDVKYRFDAISVWYDASNKKVEIKHIPSL